MTDLSKTFKATIRAIRMKINPDDLDTKLGLKNETNRVKKPCLNISNEANIILDNINKLRDFLVENKQVYMQPNYLLSNDNLISYEDRSNFENEVELSMKMCADTLKTLKDKTFCQKLSTHYKIHAENLFSLLEAYLKEVCKSYSKQKAIHVQRTIEIENLSQLYTPKLSDTYESSRNQMETLSEQEDNDNRTELLSNEEMQIFEQENEELFQRLTYASQEIKLLIRFYLIRHIESQVHDIAHLQQLFTEKILEQQPVIEQIYSTATQATDNVKLGNEEIQDAMRKNAALRLWILLIVIVLSFSLLFLDWYND